MLLRSVVRKAYSRSDFQITRFNKREMKNASPRMDLNFGDDNPCKDPSFELDGATANRVLCLLHTLLQSPLPLFNINV